MKSWSVVAAVSSLTLTATLAVLTPSEAPATPVRMATEPAAGSVVADDDAIRARLGLSPAHDLIRKDVIRDPDGTAHLRYDRTFRGLPVIGGDLVVHRSPTGRIGSVDWASHADPEALGDLTPSVSRTLAAVVARLTTALRSALADARLVVYAVGGRARLAWEATAADELGDREVAYVNADSGRTLASWSLVAHADGTGHSLYSGTVDVTTVRRDGGYELRDPTRGNQLVLDANNWEDNPPTGAVFTDADNAWGSGELSSRQSAAVDAAYGAAKTWDYFKARFGRDGIRDDGVGARSFVHYGYEYENAFWSDSCFCMVYGDGGTGLRPLVSLDIAGHEMSHGVMTATAGLIYLGESGGLNEANSDIFGTMVEFFAGSSEDRGDYYIGEKIMKTSPGWMRRMDRPALDGVSYDCWTPTMGRGDVHFTSGPANHFFYLLAEGTGAKTIGGRQHNGQTCNGTSFDGIGRLAAARIWYRALTVYLTSTSNYTVARDATIRAARDVFGAGSTQCQRVVRAWDGVEVPAGDWACSGRPRAQGANAVDNPGFEAGDNGAWTATVDAITKSTGGFPRSGNWYAHVGGYGRAHVDTVRQVVSVPSSSTARLRFWLFTNTGDVTTERADTFRVRVLAGGHATTLATYDNTQASNTYSRKSLSLSAYAGRKVTLRFVGTEDDGGQTSFLLDDVRVTPR